MAKVLEKDNLSSLMGKKIKIHIISLTQTRKVQVNENK